jgi:hypothetical protein
VNDFEKSSLVKDVPTTATSSIRNTYEQECNALLEANARLQKYVAERAAKYEPISPLDEMHRLREQATLALPELMEFVDQALEHIERLIDENDRLEREFEGRYWIPVSERLPENGKRILLSGERRVFVGYYSEKVQKFCHPDGIKIMWANPPSYWMPLPAPPEKEAHNAEA